MLDESKKYEDDDQELRRHVREKSFPNKAIRTNSDKLPDGRLWARENGL